MSTFTSLQLDNDVEECGLHLDLISFESEGMQKVFVIFEMGIESPAVMLLSVNHSVFHAIAVKKKKFSQTRGNLNFLKHREVIHHHIFLSEKKSCDFMEL